MTPPEDPISSWTIYRALSEQFMQGGTQTQVVMLLNPKALRLGPSKDRFAPEMAMMDRLGASEEDKQALREQMELVETYT